MTEELFIQFIQNKCSSDEIDEVVKWFRYDANNLSAQLLVKQIWNKYSPETSAFENVEFERILDKIHHNINISNSIKLQQNIVHFPSKKRFNLIKILMRAAAILFIPLLSVLIYTLEFSNYEEYVAPNNKVAIGAFPLIEIEAPIGSRTKIELADGTKVWLNHGSKLSYPHQFTENSRVVHLRGEAFFDVTHNPQKPFIVETENIQVTALGTEFNVMAYPEESFVNTTLVSGEVLVKKRLNQNETVEVYKMKPTQILKFNLKKNSYSCYKVKTEKYTSWKEGIIIFDNDPFDEVAIRLGKWYNVEFVIENSKVRDYVYTATFVDETLAQILELLEIATPITYKISTRKKLSNGSFSKRKVYISLKNKN